ncbi:M50 family metallopeptidase [Oceanithermus sp.]
MNTALVLILILGVSISIHELGHYLAARLQGVRVPAFSIGFGPPLLRFHWAGTEWRLSLIPLGGYAEIEGMAPDFSPDGRAIAPHRGYASLSFWGKMLILVGGVAMNLLLAWFLMAWTYTVNGIPQPIENRAQIVEVIPGTLAEEVGLKAGDVILEVDGEPLQKFTDLNKIKESVGEHTLKILRDGKKIDVKIFWDGTRDKLGVRYGPEVKYYYPSYPEAFFTAVKTSVRFLPDMVGSFVKGLSGILVGKPSPDIVGPVGIVNLAGEAARAGVMAVVQLAALINLSLAVFNLLPIPGLDGGRLLLLVLNVITGGRIKPEHEAMVNFIGFAFLILLMLLVTFQDVQRFLGG